MTQTGDERREGCGKVCGQFNFASFPHLIVGCCWHLQGQPYQGGGDCGVMGFPPGGSQGWTQRDWKAEGHYF